VKEEVGEVNPRCELNEMKEGEFLMEEEIPRN
jgi:hypothetical protein